MQEKSPAYPFLSKAVSIIFHPVFIPSLVFAFLVYVSPNVFFGIPEKTKNWWLIIIAYITITFPVLVVFLLWRLKFISGMQLDGLRERYGPLIASMLFYFWTFWLFHHQFKAPELVQSFLLGVFLTTVAVFMASIFYKISMHTAAWGGVTAFALLACFQHTQNAMLLFIPALLIAGLVGTVRLQMKAHIPFQIYSGYVAGIAGQLISFFIIHTFIF